MAERGRIAWIEWARALGACGVVLLHVLTSTILACDLSVLRLQAYAALGIVFGRWAVPAFFMITGYLLLDPKKRVGWGRARTYARRMALVLATFGLAFSIMEEAWASLSKGSGLDWGIVPRAVADVLTARSWDHLWYVYAIAVVYLLVPLVERVRSRLGKKGFGRLSMALFVVALVVPTLVRLCVVLGGSTVVLPQQGFVALAMNVADGVTCLCLGGCLRTWKLTPEAVAGGLLSLVAMLALVLCGLALDLGDLGFVILQGSCFSCAYAVLVLMVLRRVVGSVSVKEGSAVALLARDSFGIYVLHPLFVHLALIACDPLSMPAGLYEVVFYAAVLLASIVATHILRHVPLLGELL